MKRFLEGVFEIQTHIGSGSIMVQRAKYPLMIFLCGILLNRVQPFNKLFSLMECLQHLRQEKKIDENEWRNVLLLLYEKPSFYLSINQILEKIVDGQDVNLSLELFNLGRTMAQFQTERKSQIQKQKNLESQPSQEKTSEVYVIIKQAENHLEKNQQQIEKIKTQEKENICEICYVELFEEEFVPLQNCQHVFHKNCLAQSFKAQISERKFPLTCPHDTCRAQVRDSDIKDILEQEIYQKYEKNTLKSYADLNGESISWCPTADCEYMFFFKKGDESRFYCPECHKEYCLDCQVQWHSNMSCKEYQITHTTTEEDKKFLEFVKGQRYKQCPRCKFWVEKNRGCNHMTCRCQFQFCYKCGGEYGRCECVARRNQLAAERRRKKRQRMERMKVEAKKLRSERPKRRQNPNDQS